MADGQPPGVRPKRRAAARRETQFERAQRISDAYGLVLVLILITFVVTMTLAQDGGAGRVFSIVVAALTAIVALTSSDVPPGRVRSAVIIAFASVLASLIGVVISSDVLLGFAFAITAILLAIAALTILRRVVTSIAVDFRTILGAISVFTLIGLLFGFGYLALGRLQSGQVFTAVAHPKSSDFLFFSYTTLTTTGYGNLVPSGVLGEILSVFEMLIGQIFLVTFVAGLVSLWRPGARLQPDQKAADRHG